jgi:hypothetical protein
MGDRVGQVPMPTLEGAVLAYRTFLLLWVDVNMASWGKKDFGNRLGQGRASYDLD